MRTNASVAVLAIVVSAVWKKAVTAQNANAQTVSNYAVY